MIALAAIYTSRMNLLLNYSPALLFLGAYLLGDIYLATQVLIGSLIAVFLIYWVWKREIHKMHLGVAVVASVLGGLTLYLRDPVFIMYKPSAVYTAFAIALLLSHFIGDKVLLARIPQKTIVLPDNVWQKINIAWVIFFLFCAALNIYVAFNFTESTWVTFKTFGFTGLMMLFMLAHLPFISRYLPQDS